MVEDGAERIETLDDAIRRAQALVARYVPKDVSLVDDLIAERRAAIERKVPAVTGDTAWAHAGTSADVRLIR